MIAILFKMLFPFAAFYVFMKYVKKAILQKLMNPEFLRRGSYSSHRRDQVVIDICPHCGEVVGKRHKCV
jgi:hypothetical protein